MEKRKGSSFEEVRGEIAPLQEKNSRTTKKEGKTYIFMLYKTGEFLTLVFTGGMDLIGWIFKKPPAKKKK